MNGNKPRTMQKRVQARPGASAAPPVDESPRKKARISAPPSRFINPFGPHASIPLTRSTNDILPPDTHTSEQSPYDDPPAAHTQPQNIQHPSSSSDTLDHDAADGGSRSTELAGISSIDPTLIPFNPFGALDHPSSKHASAAFPAIKFTVALPHNPALSPTTPFGTLPPGHKITAAIQSSSATRSSIVQTPSPPSVSRPLPLPIPKVLTDKMMDHEKRITELEDRVEDLEVTCETALDEQRHIRDENFQQLNSIEDIANEQTLYEQRLGTLEEKFREQAKLIEQLREMLDGGAGRGLQGKEDAEGSGAKAGRDNSLAAATRRCLYLAMGIPTSSKLEDAAAIRPLKAGGSYITDPKSSGGKLLRPDWRESFNDNSRWHATMIKFLRQKAPSVVPVLTKDIMEQKSDSELFRRLENLFKNIATHYKKLQQVTEDEEDEEGNEIGIIRDNSDNVKLGNRIFGRKTRKCDERIATIEEDPDFEIPKEWSWFLQPVYQSTDESDHSDVLDPETETEAAAEPPVSATRKPWITYAPSYRSQAFQQGVEYIDKKLMERRRKYSKDNKGKTAAYPRSRAGQRDKPLPFVKPGKPKIRRGAIDPVWLSGNKEQDTPSRIHESDNEEIAAEADNEDDNEV